jgi:hypothetical protein
MFYVVATAILLFKQFKTAIAENRSLPVILYEMNQDKLTGIKIP